MGMAHRLALMVGVAAIAVGGVFGLSETQVAAGADDIRGVVRSATGPEAGVWVIAETDELETGFRKIVVTDDDGRFLVPDLPAVGFEVWVRGYGLADSDKTDARPGDELTLMTKAAATPQEAAEVYPANYWYSLLEIPGVDEFPGTGARGNGINEGMLTQAHYIDRLKDGCQLCHQMGNKATREMPMLDVRDFDSTLAAWQHRIRAGGSGPSMLNALGRMGGRALQMYADWTDRIMAGEVPPMPPRPQGTERNVVLSMWAWGTARGMVHDEIVTDKRNPTLYANGPVYGVGGQSLTVTDPGASHSTVLGLPGRIPRPRRSDSYVGSSDAIPSLYWGNEPRPPGAGGGSGHNPMMDDKGRVWLTQSIRPGGDNPEWCLEGSDHPSAQYFPVAQNFSRRQLSYYDTTADKFVLIDTCYGTHHLQFADDANDTLWTSGDLPVVGWLDTKLYDETGDERAAQGWCPTVLDTNGDGKITKPWNEPPDPRDVTRPTSVTVTDPTRDTLVSSFNYGVIPHPTDGSVWFAKPWPMPGNLIRLDPGDNPPETCITELYEPPFENDAVDSSQWGYTPRGVDVDRNGLIWTALSGSGHLASFDRTKCQVTSGPTATGQHCPEGWTVYQSPGPKINGVTSATNADFHYYAWVDQFNTLGLGANVPMANGTGSDSLLALLPETDEWVVMRVPYPLGFYTRGLDGRIDDPSAGWKGRGVWASYDAFNWHNEGGKGMTSEIVQFQVRPHPLAE